MIEPKHPKLPIKRPCELPGLARASHYHQPFIELVLSVRRTLSAPVRAKSTTTQRVGQPRNTRASTSVASCLKAPQSTRARSARRENGARTNPAHASASSHVPLR